MIVNCFGFKIDRGHRTYAFTLQNLAAPCVISGDGQREAEALPDFERISADNPSWRPCADEFNPAFCCCKSSNHLAGAGRMLVDQESDPPLHAIRAAPFREECNRLVAQCELRHEGNQADLG